MYEDDGFSDDYLNNPKNSAITNISFTIDEKRLVKLAQALCDVMILSCLSQSWSGQHSYGASSQCWSVHWYPIITNVPASTTILLARYTSATHSRHFVSFNMFVVIVIISSHQLTRLLLMVIKYHTVLWETLYLTIIMTAGLILWTVRDFYNNAELKITFEMCPVNCPSIPKFVRSNKILFGHLRF